MTPAAKTKVFISYARADDTPDYDDASKSFVRRLYNLLTAAGFDVWWDRKSLPSRGEEFTKELEDAIRWCDRFVLIVAPYAVASKYVRAEWELALSLCKPITPVLRAGDYDLVPKDFGLNNINVIDVRQTRPESESLNDLVKRLNEDAPLGKTVGVKSLPEAYLNRPDLFNAAFTALKTDAIQAAVISAPAKKETPASAVAMYGMGGIGKSTMAAALAHDCRIRRHFYDGVIWLEVGQNPNLTSLQAALGEQLGDDRQNYTEENGNLRLSALLQNKNVLIVLDDVWQSKVVEKFPVHGTPSRLLITTRSGKLAKDVHGEDIKLTTLTPEEGARLIAARANIDPADLDSKAISAFLEGHTLAVVLAAAQIAEGYAASPAEMLRLLQKRAASGVAPFRDLAVDEDDKDQNLALSLSLSYDALKLKPDLQRRFRATGVFALEGSFPLEALAAVWGDSDPDDARAPLTALLGAGLLEPAETEGRYTQHRVICAYARALLMEKGELDAVFAHYADWVIAETPYFRSSEMVTWSAFDWLLAHIFEVGDALTDVYAQSLPDAQATLAWLMRDFFFDRGDLLYQHSPFHPPHSRITWYERAIAHGRNIAKPQRLANLLFSASKLHERSGKGAIAIQLLQECLTIYTNSNDLPSIAVIQHAIADLYVQKGRFNDALELYESSLKTKKVFSDQREIVITQSKIAQLYVQQGKLDEALVLYEASLKTMQSINDPREIAVIQTSIAELYVQRGNWDEALVLYESSLKTMQYINNPREIAVIQTSMAGLYVKQSRLEEALELYGVSLKIKKQLNYPREIAITQTSMAELYSHLGRFEDALVLYKEALIILERLNDLSSLAVTQSKIGDLYTQQGSLENALIFYKAALKIMHQLNNPRSTAVTQHSMAMLYVKQGKFEDALSLFEESIKIIEHLNDPHEIAVAQQSYGQTLISSKKNVGLGIEMIWRAYITIEQFKNPREIQLISEVLSRAKQHLDTQFDEIWASRISVPQPEWLANTAQPSQEEQFAEAIRQLKGIYDQRGADAVRDLLAQNGLPPEAIEQIMGLLGGE